MAYRLLGMVVWKAGRWFLGRRYGHLVPSRRAAAAGVAGLLVLGAAGAALARGAHE